MMVSDINCKMRTRQEAGCSHFISPGSGMLLKPSEWNFSLGDKYALCAVWLRKFCPCGKTLNWMILMLLPFRDVVDSSFFELSNHEGSYQMLWGMMCFVNGWRLLHSHAMDNKYFQRFHCWTLLHFNKWFQEESVLMWSACLWRKSLYITPALFLHIDLIKSHCDSDEVMKMCMRAELCKGLIMMLFLISRYQYKSKWVL